MNSTTKTAAMVAEELNQSNENSDTKKEDIQHTKARLGIYLKKKWESKAMNDEYIRSIHREIITEEGMFLRLLREALKEETESARTSAQDQALDTKYQAT
jgi:putative ubiquitin-RnfH superfamily antitoxin RatB of RatAB toxin-antitoxin module